MNAPAEEQLLVEPKSMNAMVVLDRETCRDLTVQSRRLAMAQQLAITDDDDAQFAAQELANTTAARKLIEEHYKKIVEPAKKIIEEMSAQFKGPIDDLKQTEGIYKQKLMAWNQECVRLANEARQRQIEEERRMREAAEAEARQRQAEARAKATALAEEARKKEQAARDAENAEERARLAREAEAARVEAEQTVDRADNETAAAKMETAVALQATRVESERVIAESVPQKVGAVSFRDKWEATLTDKPALMGYVLNEAPEYMDIFEFSPSYANKLATTVQDKKKVPGLEFKNNPVPINNTGRQSRRK